MEEEEHRVELLGKREDWMKKHKLQGMNRSRMSALVGEEGEEDNWLLLHYHC